jgi:phosphatidylglycerophosphatase A
MKRHCLATMYGVGLVRIAPGTCGSLVAALLAYPILLLPEGYLWLTGAALEYGLVV